MNIEKPVLGLTTAVSLIIGTVVGSGIFLTPSNVVAAVPNPQWTMTIWLVAGLISVLGCLIFSELGTMFPKSGGQYIYLFESLGPLTAYLYGWTLISVIQTGSIAAEASIFAQFTNGLFAFMHPKLLATFIIVGFTGLNILGLKKAAGVLDFLTFLKMIALILIPLAVLFYFKGSKSGATLSLNSTPLSASTFGVGLIAAFWAYDGWNSLGYIAGAIKNPRRNIPLATIGGMFIVIFLYLSMNWAYQKVLAPSEIATSQNLANDVMTKAFGHLGGLAVSITVILATLGSTNAFIIAGSRIIQAMANNGGLPKLLTNSTYAFLLQMAWSLVLLFSGKFDELFTCVITISFLFYGLTAVALLVLKRTPKTKNASFKISSWIPWFYVLFCFVFTINSIFEKPKESLLGFALTLLGIPAYYYFKRTQERGAPKC